MVNIIIERMDKVLFLESTSFHFRGTLFKRKEGQKGLGDGTRRECTHRRFWTQVPLVATQTLVVSNSFRLFCGPYNSFKVYLTTSYLSGAAQFPKEAMVRETQRCQ